MRVGTKGLNPSPCHLLFGSRALGPVSVSILVLIVPCFCWSQSKTPELAWQLQKPMPSVTHRNDWIWRSLHISWDLQEANEVTIESLHGKFSPMVSSYILSALKYTPNNPLFSSCPPQCNPAASGSGAQIYRAGTNAQIRWKHCGGARRP